MFSHTSSCKYSWLQCEIEFCFAFPQTNQIQALCIQIFLMGDLLVHQTGPYCPHGNRSHHHLHLILAHLVLHLVETQPSVYIRRSCNHLSRGQRLMHLCNYVREFFIMIIVQAEMYNTYLPGIVTIQNRSGYRSYTPCFNIYMICFFSKCE